MKRWQLRTVITTFAIAALGLRGASGCSDALVAGTLPDEDASPVDGGEKREAAARDAAHGSSYPGWVHYADYKPECELYIPESLSVVPPIRWAGCPVRPETSGLGCRQIVRDWPKGPYDYVVTPGTRAWVNGATVVIQTARFQEDGTFRIVADADGPILAAVREMKSTECVLNVVRSEADRFAFQVFDREAEGKVSASGGGVIGGRLGDVRPKALARHRDKVERDYVAGRSGLLELGGGNTTLRSWEGGSELKPIPMAPEDRALSLAQNFFFSAATRFSGPRTTRPSTSRKFIRTHAARRISFTSERARPTASQTSVRTERISFGSRGPSASTSRARIRR